MKSLIKIFIWVELIRTLWRWNTGSPMDGKVRSDPGWFTWGVNEFHKSGKVYSWHRLPRIYRMGVRQGINLYLVGVPLCLIFLGAEATEYLYAVLTVSLAGLGGWLGVQRGRRYLRNSRTVTPLAQALSLKFGVSPGVAEKSLHFEKGWQSVKEGRLLVVDIPAHYAAVEGERAVVESVISARIGRDADYKWHTSKARNGGTIEAMVSPPLPKKVRFMDYLDEIAKNRPGEFVAGIRGIGQIERQTFRKEQAHHACCFGTGYGKSSYLTCILCQLMVQDIRNHFTVLDTKMDSLEHMRGLQGIDIWADPDNIGDMVEAAQKVFNIMRERQRAQQADPTLRGTWPFEGLVLEEANDLSSQLIGWWKREGGKGQPPFWLDIIAPLLWQGRAVNVHVLAVAQNLLDRFFGNLSLRPSFQPLYMSGYKGTQYRTMIGTPIIKAQKIVGRILVTNGAEEYWIQSLYDEPETLVKWVQDMRNKPVNEKEKADA